MSVSISHKSTKVFKKVIVPTADIYINALSIIGSQSIQVPKIGIKDGLVYELYEKISQKDLSEIEFLEEF